MAEPMALQLHGNQPFQDQLGHAVAASMISADNGTSNGINANSNGALPKKRAFNVPGQRAFNVPGQTASSYKDTVLIARRSISDIMSCTWRCAWSEFVPYYYFAGARAHSLVPRLVDTRLRAVRRATFKMPSCSVGTTVPLCSMNSYFE
eukprot:scaffold43817_cov47-Attheya_sp.AAC.1